MVKKPNFNPKKNREIVLNRQKKVAYLHLYKKMSISEIAKELDWHPDTIWNDLLVIRSRAKEQIDSIDVRGVLLNALYTREQVHKELAECMEQLKNIDLDKNQIAALKAQIYCLHTIDEIQQRTIKDLQELGFIAKPTENIDITSKDYTFKIITSEVEDGETKLIN